MLIRLQHENGPGRRQVVILIPRMSDFTIVSWTMLRRWTRHLMHTLWVFKWARKDAPHSSALWCMPAQFFANKDRSITRAGVRIPSSDLPTNSFLRASLLGPNSKCIGVAVWDTIFAKGRGECKQSDCPVFVRNTWWMDMTCSNGQT